MHNLDLLNKRLQFQGGNAEGRIIREKLNSLEKALKYSYQAEDIVKDGIEYRALINNNKLKMDYDDKIISIPFNSQIKVGDIFEWPRVNSKWIVYLQQYTEDAYFRGYIRKADYTITWKDEYGNIQQVYAAIRGPVETKIRSQMKSGITFDEPNYTLSAVVPSTEETNELKRYSRVTIADKPWQVVATDSISEAGVIDIQLIEDYLNREEDTKEVVGGKIETKIDVNSCLDELMELSINQPIELWTDVMVDGKSSKELIENSKYVILEGFAQISNNQLTITSNTKVKLQLNIPLANFSKVFEVVGVAEVTRITKDLDIIGNSTVKSFGTNVYRAVQTTNGVNTSAVGYWQYEENRRLFRVVSETADFIEFKWISGMTGQVKLNYLVDGDIYTKTISVESLL